MGGIVCIYRQPTLQTNTKHTFSHTILSFYHHNLHFQYLQCELFLFIFAYTNKIDSHSLRANKNTGAHHVRMHLQCHYRPPNQRNRCSRRKHTQRFAGTTRRSHLLRMLQRFGLIIFKCGKQPNTKHYCYRRH